MAVWVEAGFSGSLFIQCEVRQGEVGFGLHFGEAAGAAHEFVGKVAVGVDLFGRTARLALSLTR